MIKTKISIYQNLSYLGFVLYIIAVFFGTSGPQWPTKLEDVTEMTMSTASNQIVYSIVFLLAFVSILPHYKKFINWCNKEKFILLFLLWCGITILWAIDPIIAFKRYLQYLTTSFVFISILLNFKSEQTIIKTLTVIFSIYLFVTLIAVLVIPQATDPSTGTFRGLHPAKNNLGQTATINILFFFYLFSGRKSPQIKLFSLFCLLVAVILLLGSYSMTNIVLVFLFSLYFIIRSLDKIFVRIGLDKKISFIIISFIFSIVILFLLLAPDLLLEIFYSIGKDPTLTGRTEIWSLVINSSIHDLIIGVGFQSFWIPEKLLKITLFQYWIPNQSHNGYVDMVLEVGIVGLIFFILILFSLIRNLRKNKNINSLWVILIIYTLLLNFSESTLIRPHHYTNVIFYLSFWAISIKNYFPLNNVGE